jgi:Mlc titration factor MtfA (ptsG expression regulator)
MLETLVIILASIAVFVLLCYAIFFVKKKGLPLLPVKQEHRALLKEYVDFYNELDDAKKVEFENRMQYFLSKTRITAVNTEVEELDRVLLAASAIIPIFNFPDWEYINLNEVLLYPDSFNERFAQEGDERTTLGVVGDGPYQNIMILSKRELRQGFMNKIGKNNTAIHEFVHLIDKTDGAVDGIPEFLVSKQYILPWLNLMQRKIKDILDNECDINPYGATNQPEFFAVVSEYFFQQPDLLQEKHPDLYNLLAKIFRQEPQRHEQPEVNKADREVS